MANKTVEDQTPVASDVEKLANAITGAIEKTGPRRFVPYGQESRVTPFNPTGKRNRTLRRKMYQNGNPLFVRHLTDKEIELLDKIKPGVYLQGKVTVVETFDGVDTIVYIRYKNRTSDQRNELDALAPSLTAKLQCMVNEHAEQAAAIKAARKAEVIEAIND